MVGGNGAGKTQLLKLLAGEVWPDPSRRTVRRYRLHNRWHHQPQDVRARMAYVGPERQDRYERYGWNFPAWQVVATGFHRSDIPLQAFTVSDRRRSVALLGSAGVEALAQRPFLGLSFGERRLVLLARALAQRPRVLLLDEVLTGLDGENRRRARRLLGALDLRTRLVVSTAHRRADIPPRVNRLLILHRGKVRHAGLMSRAALTGALPVEEEKKGRRRRSGVLRAAVRAAPPLVRFEHADVYVDEQRILVDVSFTLRRGECWVVHGANGSGKSTLLRAVYGDHAAAEGGSIRRAGIVPGVPLEQFKARTGFIAAQLQADYPRHLTVLETVVSGRHSSIGLNERATAGELREARRALLRHGLQHETDRLLGELSYGQVRRVLFARATLTSPKLLLLDEPFAGLSGTARQGLQRALEREIQRGLTVMLATHYQSEWPTRATHELELARGRVRYAGPIRS